MEKHTKTDTMTPIEKEAADEIERLRAALKDIAVLSAGGPHLSAAEGFKKVWLTLDKARDIADAAIRKRGEDD